jgi:hypothetical protein
MKKIILTVCLLGMFGAVHAQAFRNGENRASFGVGFGWINNSRVSTSVNLPSLNALVERSIIPFKDIGFISIGAQFGLHHGYHNNKALLYDQSWTEIYFVPRAALYFHEFFDEDDFPKNIDLYAGIGLGFNHVSHKRSENARGLDYHGGFKPVLNVFAGARYYFKPHASAFAELGYGLSFLNVGLTIRY